MSAVSPLPAALPVGVAHVAERAVGGDVPVFHHLDWVEKLPWLVHGITGRGNGEGFDLGVFGHAPAGELQSRWRALRKVTGMPLAVHSRQVHGARILAQAAGPAGMLVTDAADGHATREAGILLTVSVADCVPIYLVAPDQRAVALLHAGWRGVAAGMLEAGLAHAARNWSSSPDAVLLHFGPAICGGCYEVGVEVVDGLGLDRCDSSDGPLHVDLRAALAHRACGHGVPASRITVSDHCTRCGDRAFFSHRGGDAERQMAFIGIRPEPA